MCSYITDTKCKGYRATQQKIYDTENIHILSQIMRELMELYRMADNKYHQLTPNLYPQEQIKKKVIKKTIKKSTKRKKR